MSITLDQYESCFSGTVKMSSLRQVKHEDGCIYYRCPCGGTDHYATRSSDFPVGKPSYSSVTIRSLSPLLHCWETGHQWMIVNDIDQVILNEEVKYRGLLDRHEMHAEKTYPAAEAFRLWSEQGVPLEVLETDSPEQLNELVAEHKRKSRP